MQPSGDPGTQARWSWVTDAKLCAKMDLLLDQNPTVSISAPCGNCIGIRKVESVADVGKTNVNPAGMSGLGGGEGGGDGEMAESGGPAGGLANCMSQRCVSAIARRSHLVVALR